MNKKKNETFFWGASTSAHQVEGSNLNQWSVWELENAKSLASSAKERLGWLPSWDRVQKEASNPENYVSAKGINHYQLFQEDFDLLKKLNLNSFRFSVEWSRLEPEEGRWDKKAFDYYKNYIAELKKRNIEPFLTIWHWTVPVWFSNKGGFEKRTNIKYFERFVDKLSEELLHSVKYVITLNEPNVYSLLSYCMGEWPPNKHNYVLGIRVFNNLKIAHKRSYRIIKSHSTDSEVGLAYQVNGFKPYRLNNFFDHMVAKSVGYIWNWWFLNRTRKQQDFIGVNYYFDDYFKGFKKVNPIKKFNDLGWSMNPSGLLEVLEVIAKRYPNKDIIITENGLADSEDKNRKWWLENTMEALDQAKGRGIKVKGYLHWSLLDNFEWAYGWWPKFGLIRIDNQTLKRVIKPSAIWWSGWIRDNEK